MKTLISCTLAWLRHNRYLVLALLVCGLLVSGCTWLQPKAPSPLTGKAVNRYQLEAERAEFNAKYDSAIKMIAAQDQVWTSIIDLATQAAMAVPGPVGGLVAAVPTILALGLGLDNRKKDAVIKTRTPKAAG